MTRARSVSLASFHLTIHSLIDLAFNFFNFFFNFPLGLCSSSLPFGSASRSFRHTDREIQSGPAHSSVKDVSEREREAAAFLPKCQSLEAVVFSDTNPVPPFCSSRRPLARTRLTQAARNARLGCSPSNFVWRVFSASLCPCCVSVCTRQRLQCCWRSDRISQCAQLVHFLFPFFLLLYRLLRPSSSSSIQPHPPLFLLSLVSLHSFSNTATHLSVQHPPTDSPLFFPQPVSRAPVSEALGSIRRCAPTPRRAIHHHTFNKPYTAQLQTLLIHLRHSSKPLLLPDLSA